jgi:hypothetical protein
MKKTVTYGVAMLVNAAGTIAIQNLPENKWHLMVFAILIPAASYIIGLWAAHRLNQDA